MTRKIDNNDNNGSIDVQKDVDYQREIWLAEVLEGYQPGLIIFRSINISIFQYFKINLGTESTPDRINNVIDND